MPQVYTHSSTATKACWACGTSLHNIAPEFKVSEGLGTACQAAHALATKSTYTVFSVAGVVLLQTVMC